MSDLVTVEREDHILLIGVNRSEKRNAWNLEVIRAVAEAYAHLRDEPDLRVGVVHAYGEHFTAGLDLVDVLPAVAGGEIEDILPAGSCDPWDFIAEPCPKPVVVAVQGRCLTLGIELILASQVAVAASDTEFAQLEVARGIVPFGGASYRLPARLGAQGSRYLLTAESFDAQEAKAIGLVSEIVEPGRQLTRAKEVAQKIAANAPIAVQAALATSRAAERAQRDAAASHIRQTVPQLASSKDAVEGMMAMMERRTPNFTGE
jgi:enoyl-CoA hydratase